MEGGGIRGANHMPSNSNTHFCTTQQSSLLQLLNMFVHLMCVLALMVYGSTGAAIQGGEENNLVNPEMADNEGSYFGLSGM